jgi:predicted 3-demethylubiquinone-9 3-methyltransferase (glyoxalase superfamily)
LLALWHISPTPNSAQKEVKSFDLVTILQEQDTKKEAYAMQRIAPCLWFESQAEEAADFYVSLFDNSRIVDVTRYGKAGAKASGRPEGSVMLVTFELEGQQFMALNGGPVFKFSPAISLVVHCETQQEVDRLWEILSATGQEEQCGWIKDRYGVSWQIVPTILGKLFKENNPQKSERVMQALLQMKKIDIGGLTQAA